MSAVFGNYSHKILKKENLLQACIIAINISLAYLCFMISNKSGANDVLTMNVLFVKERLVLAIYSHKKGHWKCINQDLVN